MPEKDPTTWSLATWALILGMSILGGVSRVLAKARDYGCGSISLIGFIADLATSGLVGVASFMVLISFDYPVSLCAAASGMSGHLATRIIFLSFGITNKVADQVNSKISNK
jgi:hypothetical protein